MPWIKFKIEKYPFYDENGNILPSIEGMRNRPGIDKFTGGGSMYPPIVRSLSNKIVEWYEKEDVLLLNLDISGGQVNSILVRDSNHEFNTAYKGKKVNRKKTKNFQNFEPIVISDVEAELMKVTFFGVSN